MANEVRIVVKADDQASKVFKETGESAKGLGRELSDVGKIAAGVLTADAIKSGASSLIQSFGSMTSSASNLAESMSKAKVVFGDSFGSIQQLSEDAAKSMGLSKQQALEFAGTFGNLFTAMGIGQDKAAGMSKELLQLGADLASFNNISVTDALDKLRAGLVGEAEPLRTLGVNLTADAVKAKALEMGLVPLTQNITEVKDAELDLAEAQKKLNDLRAQGPKTEQATAQQLKAVANAQDDVRLKQEAAALAQRKYNEAVKEHGRNSTQAKSAEVAMHRAQEATSKSIEKLTDARAKAVPVTKGQAASTLDLEKAQLAVTKAEEKLAEAQKGSTSELTAAMKAQATYQLILEQTGTAQGDFERTSGGLANQQRILKAEMENFRAEMGNKLQPVLLQAFDLFRQLPAPVQTFGFALMETGPALGQLAFGLGAALPGFARLVPALAGLVPMLGSLGAALLLPPLGFVTALVAAGVAIYIFRDEIMSGLGAAFDYLKKTVGPAAESLRAAFSSVLDWLRDNWPIVATLISGPFAPLVALATDAFGVRSALEEAFKWIVKQFKKLGDIEVKINYSSAGPLGSVPTGISVKLPSYATGTPFVPATGLALLHRGEAVIPASQNRASNLRRRGDAADFGITIRGNVTVNNHGQQQDADGALRALGYAIRMNARSRGVPAVA